jgi:hypothetical protein
MIMLYLSYDHKRGFKLPDIIKSFRFNVSDKETWLKFKGKVASEGETIKEVIIKLISEYLKGEKHG